MTKVSVAEQIETLHYVLNSDWVTDWSVAVDGGANCGDWSFVMWQWFREVHAFEASPETYVELRDRMSSYESIHVHQKALLDRKTKVIVHHMPKKPSTRSRYVIEDNSGNVQAIPLDSLKLQSCGLLKLDIEGAEYKALIGARETIKRCRPVIIVEVDKHGSRFGVTDQDTVALIESMGYKLAYEQEPDKVFIPI